MTKDFHLSRKLVLLIMFIGALFVITALDLLFFKKVLNLNENANPILKIIGPYIFLILGGVIFLSQIQYLIKPAVMLRITPTEILFGTGLRYKLYAIPIENIQTVEIETGVSNLKVMEKERIVEKSVKITFKPSQNVPSSMATSMGISYYNNILRISKPYLGESLSEVKDFLEKKR